ncbi:MAG: DUF1992 domain-containing protein [Desertimonas sp.]
MTRRKPPGLGWEAWTERLIREGVERGEFDDLAGHGHPLRGIDGPRDELWWVRDKLRREALAALPLGLQLRRERADLLARLTDFAREEELREAIEELNGRIRHLNRYGASGPPSTVMVLDAEETVERWRSG